MIKIITNTFNFQDRSVTRIDRGRNLTKSAASNAEIAKYLQTIKSEPGLSKFHILALGAGEFYSSNRNGDWFGEQPLRDRHNTFVRFGHVFRHHVNKDSKKKYGDIHYSCYSNIMHRVELIVSLINDKNADVLEKYDRGDTIPVSMAAKLKYDLCSICSHRSKSFAEYCVHLRDQMNRILPDGRKVYAINPDPLFFDLSLVYRPADPTAYFFDKVASGDTHLSAYWGEVLYGNEVPLVKLSSDLIEKKAIIRKLADLEKHIEGVLSGKVDDGKIMPLLSAAKTEDFPHSVLDQLKCLPLSKTLGSCADHKIMLSLKEFLNLISKDSLLDKVKDLLPGSFSRLDDEADEELLNFDFGLDRDNLPIYNIIKKFVTDRKIDDNFFNGKTLSLKFSKKPKVSISRFPGGMALKSSAGSGQIIIKSSSDSENIVADRLAKLYNLYKIAFCKRVSNNTAVLVSLLSNYQMED